MTRSRRWIEGNCTIDEASHIRNGESQVWQVTVQEYFHGGRGLFAKGEPDSAS